LSVSVAIADVKTSSRRAALASGLVPFLAGLVLAGPFCFTPIDETDIGWHLALGRHIASAGIPRHNALAWTAPDYPWYATSWAFDWICYRLDAALGVLGLQLLTFALLALTLACVTVASRRADPEHGAWLSAVVALLLIPRITPRPHLVSWVVLAACVALGTAGRGGSWRMRAACIPLIAFGSNFHAGAIFSAFALASFCAEAALLERRVVSEVLIAIGGFLALMANPGGPFNIFYAAEHLRVYELLKLSEFQTPRLLDLPAFYLVIPIALGLAVLGRRWRPAGPVLVLGFALGGIWAARIAFKFYLIAAETLAAGLPLLRERYGRRAWLLLWGLLSLMGIASNTRRYLNLTLDQRWDNARLPIRAAKFIRGHRLEGHYFNSFSDGGYLEYALPNLPAFQDGRVQAYPPEFFLEQLEANTPEKFDRFLRRLGVEWALARGQDTALNGNSLIPTSGWALVYWDDLNELFVRRDIPRFQALIAQNEFHYFQPESVTPASMLEVVQGLGQKELLAYAGEVARFQQSTPDDRFAALARCALAVRLSSIEAPSWCEQAAKLSNSRELQTLIERAQRLPSLR
jgi:hypothetical protein